jgi:hypothetical protein
MIEAVRHIGANGRGPPAKRASPELKRPPFLRGKPSPPGGFFQLASRPRGPVRQAQSSRAPSSLSRPRPPGPHPRTLEATDSRRKSVLDGAPHHAQLPRRARRPEAAPLALPRDHPRALHPQAQAPLHAACPHRRERARHRPDRLRTTRHDTQPRPTPTSSSRLRIPTPPLGCPASRGAIGTA